MLCEECSTDARFGFMLQARPWGGEASRRFYPSGFFCKPCGLERLDALAALPEVEACYWRRVDTDAPTDAIGVLIRLVRNFPKLGR